MKKVLVMGEINVDLIFSGCQGPPTPGKEILAERFHAVLGSASAICAVGLARLGTPVAFLGKVGADDWGSFCVRALSAEGIDVSRVVEDRTLATGVTVAISTFVDRALVTFLGSVRALVGAELTAAVLEGFDHLHVSSYFLQEGLRAHVPRLFAEAHRLGLTTSLDPGFDPEERWGADLREALAEADLFLPNEVEACAVGGRADPLEALRALGAGRTRVVAKLGPGGAATLEAGEVLHVPAFPVTPLDTTGAGDSFNAGFLHAWLAGRPLREALRLGAACGALSTLGVGGTARQPTLAEADAFVRGARVISDGTRIVVAGFNTALDKRVELDRFSPGAVNRARLVEAYPGGKGLHVAVTVAALGVPVALVGLVERARADELSSFLAARGVELHGVPVDAPLRTCLALYEADGRVTELLEPGAEVPADAAAELVARFEGLAAGAAFAVCSGSLPPGLGDDTYASAIEALRRRGVRCLVDASGEALRLAVAARPFLVKPNRDEAERLTGTALPDLTSAGQAARRLAAGGVATAVVSLGRDGALAAADGELLHAHVEVPDARHPVGSGDAMSAGLAVAFSRDLPVAEALRLGVACGAANARSPQQGFVTRPEIEALLPSVSVRRWR